MHDPLKYCMYLLRYCPVKHYLRFSSSSGVFYLSDRRCSVLQNRLDSPRHTIILTGPHKASIARLAMPKRRLTTIKSTATKSAEDHDTGLKVKRSKYLKNDKVKGKNQNTEQKEQVIQGGEGDCKTDPQTSTSPNPPEAQAPDDVTDNRCGSSFFDQPCEDLAKQLLGKTLVRVLDGERLSGVIVETEAYPGGVDKASHSYNGKRTARNEAMYMAPGTAYVYHIYGMYTCLNISSKGDGAAVLLRGLDAADGTTTMRTLRGKKRADGGNKLKIHELGNGPSKLTQALDIGKAEFDQQDLTSLKSMWIEDGDTVSESSIISSSRIGIGNYAEEWTDKPFRYYVRGRKGVSVRDKAAESSDGPST